MKADERTIQIARITFGSSSQTFQSTGQQQPDPSCQELLTAHLSKNGNLYDIYSTFPRKILLSREMVHLTTSPVGFSDLN